MTTRMKKKMRTRVIDEDDVEDEEDDVQESGCEKNIKSRWKLMQSESAKILIGSLRGKQSNAREEDAMQREAH